MTMEPEPRTTVPAHATGAVELVRLSSVSEDGTFRLRDEGDVSELAASIGRLGQLVPVELRWLPDAADGQPRYQPICGFRRLAALRMLARDRVLARVHGTLADDDAWALALTDVLLREPLIASELDALRERLAEVWTVPWAAELVDAALGRAPVDPALRERFAEFIEGARGGSAVKEPVQDEPVQIETAQDETAQDETVEVTPEELAEDLPRRMFEVNQDLVVAIDAWEDLPAEGRRRILEQARWIATEILPVLEGREE
jgi:hypothetical protein